MPTRHTFVLAYPGCIAFEVMLAAEIANRHAPVRLATPDGRPFANSNGMTFLADCAYAQVDPGAACLLVPGGDPAAIMEDQTVDRLLRAAAAGPALIGGICAGVLVLAKAGILAGRTITHNYTPRYAPPEIVAATRSFWQGAQVVDQPVAVDGRIITALPYGAIDFAMAVALGLGAYDQAKAALMGAYYRGGYPFEPLG